MCGLLACRPVKAYSGLNDAVNPEATNAYLRHNQRAATILDLLSSCALSMLSRAAKRGPADDLKI